MDPNAPEPSRPPAAPPAPARTGPPHPPHDDEAAELAALGYVPPDPDEAPPVDLWSAVGDVRPWGTLLLLLSWGVVFALTAATGALAVPRGLLAWGANATELPWTENAWRLLASTFLHAGAAHVFFNATSLLVTGQAVERIFTRTRFWLVYAAGGTAASLASLAWRTAREGASLSVGGSGAVFALGGALLVAAVRLRRQLAPTRSRALAAALLYLLAPGFAAGYAKPGTDNVAHAAGLACGALLGALLPLDPRLGGRAPGVATRALAVLAVLALAGALVLALRGGLAGR